MTSDGAFGRCPRCASFIRLREPSEDLHDALYFQADRQLEMTPASLIQQYLDHIETRVDLEGASILDVGCGVSDTWRHVAARGARYVGVEPSAPARAQMHRLGVDVREELPVRGTDSFDVGLLIEVIEHTYEGFEMLAGLRDALPDAGLVFLATPNALSLRARLRGENWEQARNPTHVCLFSRSALEEMLVDSGYQPLSWQRWITNPGPFARKVMQRGLQSVGLDGGLRVLAQKRP